ncbi:MAG: hypothetical protein ACREJC_11655, partial [Tepidisphaeraceae bacterium]
MRSLLLIIATIIALGGGFLLYIVTQPARPPARRSELPVSAPRRPPAPSTTQNLPIEKGENVYVETYDKKTGELVSRFRALEYSPAPEGTVEVLSPEAEFYLSGGEVVRVRGRRGRVVLPPGSSTAARTQPPSRGELHDVELELFQSPKARRPQFTCWMNNASFDNDTFSIATESFKDADGQVVAADQVPVTVRGEKANFDGRGLVIRWDERDRRLRLLEIAHGEKLVLKDPDSLGGGSLARSSRGEPIELVSSDPRDAKAVAIDPGGVAYRATFAERVRVTQDTQTLASADELSVDFLAGEPEPDRRAADA